LDSKSKAILFFQQVNEFEANQLPLLSYKLIFIIVSEKIENVNRHKEFSVIFEHLQTSLRWLKANNKLHRSVKIEISKDVERICSQIFVNAEDDLLTTASFDNRFDESKITENNTNFKLSIRNQQYKAIAATVFAVGQSVCPFIKLVFKRY